MKFLDKNDKRIKRILILAVIFLGLMPFIMIQSQVISQDTSLEYLLPAQKLEIKSIPVSQVVITNFSATASLYPWCSGNGTITNPYIIENLTVDKYISITNTADYFIIRNCTISSSHNYVGITLENVQNGRIINNILCNNTIGIKVKGSYNIIMNNTICDNKEEGIFLLFDSREITIINNTINKNGYTGIVYYYNNVDGICTGNTIYNNRLNGIYLKEARNNTIEDNNIYDNYCGILMFNSTKTIIKNNSIHNNMDGIHLNPYIMYPGLKGENATPGSTYNTITENIIYNNRYNGILLYASDRNVVKNNTLRNNSRSVCLDNYSNANLLYLNYFFENSAFDLGSYNHWDNGSIGNYWSDYTGADANNDGIGDTPYNGSFFQDNYPIYISSPSEEGIPGFQLMHIIIVLVLGLVLIRFKFRNYLKEYKRG